MSLVADARADLFGALQAAFGATPWRVHQWPPGTIAAPAVWIDDAQLGGHQDGLGVVCTFPIWVVVDGVERRQVEALDDMMAVIWDAIEAADARPQATRSAALDVGGPTLRARVLPAEVSITARTLCPVPLAPIPEGVSA